MNNFKVVVKEYFGSTHAEESVNEFIKECTEQGHKIVDITSNSFEVDGIFIYTFIFKMVHTE